MKSNSVINTERCHITNAVSKAAVMNEENDSQRTKTKRFSWVFIDRRPYA
jgi:hypothetical protein